VCDISDNLEHNLFNTDKKEQIMATTAGVSKAHNDLATSVSKLREENNRLRDELSDTRKFIVNLDLSNQVLRERVKELEAQALRTYQA